MCIDRQLNAVTSNRGRLYRDLALSIIQTGRKPYADEDFGAELKNTA